MEHTLDVAIKTNPSWGKDTNNTHTCVFHFSLLNWFRKNSYVLCVWVLLVSFRSRYSFFSYDQYDITSMT